MLDRNILPLSSVLLDELPEWIVRRDLYRRVRKSFSIHKARYEPLPEASIGTRGLDRDRKLASPLTTLVIDGFSGSGNSFASNCVRAAINVTANLESHFHFTVQLKRARAFQVPTIVLVRRPLDAINSLKSKKPLLWDWLIVLRWLRYHRYVLGRREDFYIVLFDDFTRDVEILRRICPPLQRLTVAPLTHDLSLRRRGTAQSQINAKSWPTRWLLKRAENCFRQVEGDARGG